jgi:hypothetical protein
MQHNSGYNQKACHNFCSSPGQLHNDTKLIVRLTVSLSQESKNCAMVACMLHDALRRLADRSGAVAGLRQLRHRLKKRDSYRRPVLPTLTPSTSGPLAFIRRLVSEDNLLIT